MEERGMSGWRALGFNSYKEYLDNWIWKEKSNNFKEQIGKCQLCNSKENLQVHHLNYEHVGNESKKDVICICKRCHKNIHLEDKNGLHS